MVHSKITCLLILFIACYACKHDSAKPAVADCKLPAAVSFNNDIMPVINKYCNTAGCHAGNSPAGNLNLEPAVAYSKLLNSSSGYVDTINPQYSLLYAQMNSTSQPMPPTGKLDKCTLDLVLKWIQQKAKNN